MSVNKAWFVSKVSNPAITKLLLLTCRSIPRCGAICQKIRQRISPSTMPPVPIPQNSEKSQDRRSGCWCTPSRQRFRIQLFHQRLPKPDPIENTKANDLQEEQLPRDRFQRNCRGFRRRACFHNIGGVDFAAIKLLLWICGSTARAQGAAAGETSSLWQESHYCRWKTMLNSGAYCAQSSNWLDSILLKPVTMLPLCSYSFSMISFTC